MSNISYYYKSIRYFDGTLEEKNQHSPLAGNA